MLADILNRIADFCKDFPRLAGGDRYFLFANFPDQLYDALDATFRQRQVRSVYRRDERVRAFGFLWSDLFERINDYLGEHPLSTVDNVASALEYQPGTVSRVLREAFDSRIMGRRRRGFLRTYEYFPLWCPNEQQAVSIQNPLQEESAS